MRLKLSGRDLKHERAADTNAARDIDWEILPYDVPDGRRESREVT